MLIFTAMEARCFSVWFLHFRIFSLTISNRIHINKYKLEGLQGSCLCCFLRSLRDWALACDEGYKKEEIMGNEEKRNEDKGMECKAWPGAGWLPSLRKIILVFSYNSLWPGDCYYSLTEETVISDPSDRTCFGLEDILCISMQKNCHWTQSPSLLWL